MIVKTWELGFCWLVLQALDVITTAAALMAGAVELNPAMQGDPWRMVAVKVGAGVAIVAVAVLLPPRLERVAKGGLVAGVGLAGAVVAWNVAMLALLGGAA